MTLTEAFATGIGIGVGVCVAYWCLTSARDFFVGYWEARCERLGLSSPDAKDVRGERVHAPQEADEVGNAGELGPLGVVGREVGDRAGEADGERVDDRGRHPRDRTR